MPTITLGNNPSACYSANAQTVNLTYSDTTANPTTYSIAWISGLNNLTDTTLSSTPIVINVPASLSAATYSGKLTVKNANGCLSKDNAISVKINTLPTPTFINQPGATICSNTDVTYSTQSGMSNYQWTIPGISGTDYSITSGGTTTDSSVTLKWLTTGK